MSIDHWLQESAANGISKRAAREALLGAGYTHKQVDAALLHYKPVRAEPIGLTVIMVVAIVLVLLAVLIGIVL
jgi:hypothetical protein